MKETKQMKQLFHLSYLKFRIKFYFYKYHSVKQMKEVQKAFWINFTISLMKKLNWKSQNQNSKYLFPLKDKDLHHACKIYKGICSCESTYVGETKRNVEVRYSEHNHPSRKSEPSKHLHQNINYVFSCLVICSAPKSDRTRKILKRFIKLSWDQIWMNSATPMFWLFLEMVLPGSIFQ